MKTDACIWQFGVDYPGADGNDMKLPIDSVSVKAWDETYWMSTFDGHSSAISGPAAIRELVNVYAAQGIDLLLWCVPKGRNVARQIELSLACLDVPGVKGLIFDVEPFAGFCASDCLYLAQNLARRVREMRPNAWLGAHYDPRPQHWAPSGLTEWFKYLDGVLPMVYWRTFAGQGAWGLPDAAVSQAENDLRNRFGFRGEYFPILQGDAPPSEMTAAIQTAAGLGSTRISLWRRGVVRLDTWRAIASFAVPTLPAPPPTPEPDGEELTVGQYEELKGMIEGNTQSIGNVNRHLTALDRLVHALHPRLAPQRAKKAIAKLQGQKET
jgi:hypothetical protein